MLVIEAGCNNSCFFCELRKKNLQSFDFYVRMLKEFRKEGYSSLDITGGEPTLYYHIFRLIKTAKKLGFRDVSLFTNGRLLNYKSFTERLLKAGVDKIFVSFFSDNKIFHEKITRVPGSFCQSFEGLKNIREIKKQFNGGVEVFVNLTLLKENSQKIREIVSFFSNYTEQVNIMPLLPSLFSGKSKIQIYKSFCANVQDIDLGDANVKLSGFPACLVKGKVSNTKNKDIKVLSKEGVFEFEDIVKEYTYFSGNCNGCELKNKCFGYIKNSYSDDFFTLWLTSDLHVSEKNEKKVKSIFNDMENFFFSEGVVAGDIVEGELDEYSYEVLKKIQRENNIIKTLNFIAGNHDYLYESSEDEKTFSLENYLKIISSKLNYSFTKHNLHFIFASMDETPNKIKNKTLDWIKNEINKNKEKIIILVTHMPFFCLDEGVEGLDIWISGHKSFKDFSQSSDVFLKNGALHIYAGDVNSMRSRFLVFQKDSQKLILKRRNHYEGFFEEDEEFSINKKLQIFKE